MDERQLVVRLRRRGAAEQQQVVRALRCRPRFEKIDAAPQERRV
ncbi:MAG: hypothetical protein R3F11_05840 [Verrucomicrobiales bacterium]